MGYKKSALAVAGAIGVAGALHACSGNTLDDFESQRPVFRPEVFLAGETKAWGVVYDWKGKVIRRLTVSLQGRVDGDRMTLDEQFSYDDGETDSRHWDITKLTDNTYEATSPDVVGKAEGERRGNAFRWQYTLRQKSKGGTVELFFDDWQFAIDDAHVFNRVSMSKLGVPVGEVFIFISRDPG